MIYSRTSLTGMRLITGGWVSSLISRRTMRTCGLWLNLLLPACMAMPASDVLAAPTPANLLLRDNDPLRPPRRLNSAEVQRDMELLVYALDRGYAGCRFVPADAFQQAKDRLRSLAQNSESLRPSKLCDSIGNILWSLPDAHLSARIPPGEECGALRRRAHRTPRAGENTGRKHRGPWSLAYRRIRREEIPVLAIKKFPPREDAAWQGYTEEIGRLLSSPSLIIDLRGNGGGDDSRGFELAEKLVGQPLGPGWDETIFRETPETFALFRNIGSLMAREQAKDGVVPTHIASFLEKNQRLYDTSLKGTMAEERIERHEHPYRFHASSNAYPNPIYVLVDSDCGSSCESTLEALRAHPKTVVIGERTAGFVHFGNVGVLVLPSSRIFIGIPTKFNRYATGKFFDKVGFEPDVSVKAGEDALDVAVRALKADLALRPGGS